MFKGFFILLNLIVLFNNVDAQSTYLDINTNSDYFIDRIITKSGQFSDILFQSDKPISRARVEEFIYNFNENLLTPIDKKNFFSFKIQNSEKKNYNDTIGKSIYPILKHFYKYKYDFWSVNDCNFHLIINPIISGELIFEMGSKKPNYWSARGVEIKGSLASKLGFYFLATDNQETDISFINSWIKSHSAIPGADYYIGKTSGNYDYFLSTGYIDIPLVKNYTNLQFGYGKNFIGDGIYSMFLSDFSSAYPFLKLNTKFWKFNYQNLFSELTTQHGIAEEILMPHKYAAMHHLNINVCNWLNLGVFESIIFARNNGYEIRYLNPVIFLGSMEQSLGSPDKKHIGIDFKAIPKKGIQIYSQFLLDEFKAREFFSNNGWWGNKWALQLGLKFYDIFRINNLDLQIESNIVRPYTYTHSDTISNYTNYNQPLAHPLGANFIQFVSRLNYQPINRLRIEFIFNYYLQGIDSNASNYGSDIFYSYNTRVAEYNNKILQGIKVNGQHFSTNLSYELKPNLFIDFGIGMRKYLYENREYENTNSTYLNFGFRLNIKRKETSFI